LLIFYDFTGVKSFLIGMSPTIPPIKGGINTHLSSFSFICIRSYGKTLQITRKYNI